MQTKKFESNIKQQLEPVSTDWVQRLKTSFPFIDVRKTVTNQSRAPNGRIFKKLAFCDLHLRDEMIIMTIAQDREKLVFFYFGMTPDETCDQCLFELSVIRQYEQQI